MEVTMPDSPNVPEGLQKAVIEAFLMELGGERLDGSGLWRPTGSPRLKGRNKAAMKRGNLPTT